MTKAPAAEELTGVAGWAVGLMESLGGPGAALVVGLDNLFPPLPSELVLPLAGFAAGRGTFGLGSALFWTTFGSVAGAVVGYLLGRRLGHDRTRRLVSRLPLVDARDFDRTAAWFARHGGKAVFLGRMIPLFRSFVSVPAGVERMPFGRFLLFTTAGSLVWNTAFVGAGYLLGEHWHRVEGYASIFQYVVFAAIAAGAGVFVVRRIRARRPG
ncbi:DedA family protein [Amycolatopsis sp. CA-128772]|uniref:DedA family protein n=1 Tax=Amycolatopsis sp. CA-128772 TaxID=2073159 RepID=UPI000CD21D3B|nr:DedA family protein [Amycolatopsis sp. CA-128772]